jgi:hypothetical protein
VRDRVALGIGALFFSAVAFALLAFPRFFYDAVPGVAESGPANLHLLRDVGLAYAVLALGFALAVNDATLARAATAAAALYLAGHAALHATLAASGAGPRSAWAEAPGVYLPALAALWLAVRMRARRLVYEGAGPSGSAGASKAVSYETIPRGRDGPNVML